MSTEIKFKSLVAFALICLIGLLVQGAMLWRMDREIASLQGDDSSIPESIEQRLLAQLDKSSNRRTIPAPNSLQNGFSADPFARMEQMRQQMDSIFNGFGMTRQSPFTGLSFSSGSPAINLVETDDAFQLEIMAPPNHELELNTELEDNRLVLNGLVKGEQANGNRGLSTAFVSQSSFSRSFQLPEPVDEFGLTTEKTEEGLVIKIPKASS